MLQNPWLHKVLVGYHLHFCQGRAENPNLMLTFLTFFPYLLIAFLKKTKQNKILMHPENKDIKGYLSKGMETTEIKARNAQVVTRQ